INDDQVMKLDTPNPLLAHIQDYPNPGRVDRYISSLFGRFAPELGECLGRVGTYELNKILLENGCILPACRGSANIKPSAYYYKYDILPSDSLGDHQIAPAWYTVGVVNGEQNGFWISPCL